MRDPFHDTSFIEGVGIAEQAFIAGSKTGPKSDFLSPFLNPIIPLPPSSSLQRRMEAPLIFQMWIICIISPFSRPAPLTGRSLSGTRAQAFLDVSQVYSNMRAGAELTDFKSTAQPSLASNNLEIASLQGIKENSLPASKLKIYQPSERHPVLDSEKDPTRKFVTTQPQNDKSTNDIPKSSKPESRDKLEELRSSDSLKDSREIKKSFRQTFRKVKQDIYSFFEKLLTRLKRFLHRGHTNTVENAAPQAKHNRLEKIEDIELHPLELNLINEPSRKALPAVHPERESNVPPSSWLGLSTISNGLGFLFEKAKNILPESLFPSQKSVNQGVCKSCQNLASGVPSSKHPATVPKALVESNLVKKETPSANIIPMQIIQEELRKFLNVKIESILRKELTPEKTRKMLEKVKHTSKSRMIRWTLKTLPSRTSNWFIHNQVVPNVAKGLAHWGTRKVLNYLPELRNRLEPLA